MKHDDPAPNGAYRRIPSQPGENEILPNRGEDYRPGARADRRPDIHEPQRREPARQEPPAAVPTRRAGEGYPARAHTGSKGKRSHKQKKPMGTAARVVLIVFGILLLAAAAFLAKFLYDMKNPAGLFDAPAVPVQSLTTPAPSPDSAAIQRPQSTPVQDISQPAPAPTPTIDPEAALMADADLSFMESRANILLLGVDQSVEREEWSSFRTDTMVLASVNFDTGKIDLITIPRDSYVRIFTHKGEPALDKETGLEIFAKINSAFSTGGGAKGNGYGYAMETVSNLLGVPVNYYMAFNMNVVKEIVDAIGGVDYDVDVPVQMNGRQLQPGYQHLDGQQVLDYCRQRKGSSDIARSKRQQRMLITLFQQMKEQGTMGQLPKIYRAVQDNMATNLSFSQISALALLAYRSGEDAIAGHSVEGEYLDMNHLSYWGVSTEKVALMIEDIFGVELPMDAAIDVSVIKGQLALAAAAVEGEAQAAQLALQAADALLQQFSDWFPDPTRAAIDNAVLQVTHAMELQDGEQIVLATQQLLHLCQQLVNQLAQYGQTPSILYQTVAQAAQTALEAEAGER